MNMLVCTAVAVVACTTLAAASMGEHPPVFADMTFAEALAQTKDTDKILVVKATAEWCPPCKKMDRTTWVDDRVVKWVEANGVAIQVDVDKNPDVSRQLRVRAMPTMIVFKKGEEFDRVVGYQSADQLLGWLEAVKRGERSADRLKQQADRAKDDPDRMGMQERLRLAQELSRAGEHQRATEEFLWLWENMTKREPAMVGVRGSFMANSMRELAAEHEPAREAFAKVRDEAEERLKGENKSWDDLDDWIVLNMIVGEEDKTLEWFDRIKGDPGAERTLRRFAFRLENLLEERERWEDYVRLVGDPVKKVRTEHARIQMLDNMTMGDADEGQRQEILGFMWEHFRERTGVLHGACLAAGKPEDAEQVAAEGLKLDDTAEMRLALVRAGLEFDRAAPMHRRLLDEAEARGANRAEVRTLRDRVEDLLKGRG